MDSSLDKELRYLKGIGEKRAALFARPGIRTIGDLIAYYPRDYEDWSTEYSIAGAPTDHEVCIRATVTENIFTHGSSSGIKVSRSAATDGECAMTLVFFNNPFVKDTVFRGAELLFYGRIKETENGRREMTAPKIAKPEGAGYLHPVYPRSGELTSRMIARAVKTALDEFGGEIPETLPEEQIRKYRLTDAKTAARYIHFPKNKDEIESARRRLIYEELLVLQLGLLTSGKKNRTENRFVIEKDFSDEFASLLPFTLTLSQKEAIARCVEDMRSSSMMQRLVQGDVGSGKTAVAASLIYTCVKNGFQCALMAPTEVLAAQHHKTFMKFFENTGIRTVLLTGSMTAKAKKAVKEAIASGEADVVIGTHALITEDVEFRSLALTVTDEQHRFGVRQRAKLRNKGASPHVLVMSATPIPRTLSLIIYGDLDVSVLREKPGGRQQIKTYSVNTSYRERLYAFVKKEIAAGHQCYIVCPLVEETENTLPDRVAAEDYIRKLSSTVFREQRTALLHGKMKPKEKDEVMKRFKDGEIDVLICTVVVEVGIDVPNATVMMIENAECFGLSQLHQLRGRVGRGSAGSYCILISDAAGETAKTRFEILCSSDDGFKIADEDLKLRGPGDFFGDRQSGLPSLKIADLMTDSGILFAAREEAEKIVQKDPALSSPEYAAVREKIGALFSEIS